MSCYFRKTGTIEADTKVAIMTNGNQPYAMRNILICERLPIITTGLRILLMHLHVPAQEIHEITDSEDLLPTLRERQITHLLFGTQLRGTDVWAILTEVMRLCPQVVILMYEDVEKSDNELPGHPPAHFYIPRDSSQSAFFSRLEAFIRHRPFGHPEQGKFDLRWFNNTPFGLLNAFEQHIVSLLLQGAADKDIRLRLNLTSENLDLWRDWIFQRLSVKDVYEMKALARQWIPADKQADLTGPLHSFTTS